METNNYEERLYKIFNNVNDWLKFAEAKNFGLLTLNGAIVFGFTQSQFAENSLINKGCPMVFVIFAITSFLFCLIPLFPILNSIANGKKKNNSQNIENPQQNTPDNKKKEENTESSKQTENKKGLCNFLGQLSGLIDDETPFENIHYYGYLRTLELTDFEAKFLEKTKNHIPFSKYEKELGDQIIYNSRIAWLKYRFFKSGAFFFLLGITFYIISFLF